MLPSIDELKAALTQHVPGASLGADGSILLVQPNDLLRVCEVLKAAPYYLDYVANLTAVDYPPDPAVPPSAGSATGGAGKIDMVYHLYSMTHKHGPVAIRVSLPLANPVIASLTPLYRGAEFQEREVYDLFGVTFEGHPDLRRILMWDEFVGHPMRKDYVPEDQDAPA